jgi:hypothetical protein
MVGRAKHPSLHFVSFITTLKSFFTVYLRCYYTKYFIALVLVLTVPHLPSLFFRSHLLLQLQLTSRCCKLVCLPHIHPGPIFAGKARRHLSLPHILGNCKCWTKIKHTSLLYLGITTVKRFIAINHLQHQIASYWSKLVCWLSIHPGPILAGKARRY